MSGEEIAEQNDQLKLASSLVKEVIKVEGGLQVKLTFAGKMAVKVTPHNIPNETVFKIEPVIFTDKKTGFKISAKEATFFGKSLKLYLKGNSYSMYGKTFTPIFNK
jgi:hypothetical protein